MMADIVLATNLDMFDMLDAKCELGNLYNNYAKQCLCILECHCIHELVLLQFYHVTAKIRSLGFCHLGGTH